MIHTLLNVPLEKMVFVNFAFSNHLPMDCTYARSVLEGVSRWCNTNMEPLHSVKDVVDSISRWGTCKNRRKIILTIYYGIIWSIWKSRNEKVFEKNRLPPDKIIDIIKSMAYLWVKNKRKIDRLNLHHGLNALCFSKNSLLCLSLSVFFCFCV